ncbi:PEGA domain-containing protein [Sorangium sp. So ce448]|uniref:PEGA domain-containing protein n=1 Tax=Sorangium sp. So ce448 TaxID=3133314 RepID=UPI003F64291A
MSTLSRKACGAQAQGAEHRWGVGLSPLAPPPFAILVLAAGVALVGCAVRPADVPATPTPASSSLQETPAERTELEGRASCWRVDIPREPTWQSSSLKQTPTETTARLEQAMVTLDEVLTRVVILNLVTVPEGAQMTVDGCVRGRSPLLYKVFLEPGRHVIEADLRGYMPTLHVIETTAGETLGLTVELRPSRTEVLPHEGCTEKQTLPVERRMLETLER